MATDRAKAKTYGEARIPEYWLVNLPDRSIELYRNPSAAHDTGNATPTILTERDNFHLMIEGHDHGHAKLASVLP